MEVGILVLNMSIDAKKFKTIQGVANGMDASTCGTQKRAKVEMSFTTHFYGVSILEIATIGIDLAKNVFQIHAVNEYVKTVLREQSSQKKAFLRQ